MAADQDLAVPSTAPAPRRLLFLHGLFRKTYPQSGRTVAELLAKGLDGAAVAAAPDLLLDDGGRCPRYLVRPEAETAAWEAVEVVEVQYDDIIEARDDNRPFLRRALSGFWALAADGPRLLRLLLPGHPRITARQAGMAGAMALVVVMVVAFALAVLIPIVYGAYGYMVTVLDWAGILAVEPAAARSDPSGATANASLAGSIALLALLAVTERLLVSKNLAAAREDAAHSIFAVLDYQKPRSKLRPALLERVRSALRAGVKDGRSVSLLAFSQGSLLAIDALFPPGPVAQQAPRPRIDLLVTFGCPLAVVTRLRPARPPRPPPHQAEVGRWINFYETNDQLGGPIAALVEAEGVGTAVEDRELSHTDAAGRPAPLPHFAYWLEGPRDQRPTPTEIAPDLVGVPRT